jgi:hypothetical protein
MQVVIRNPIVMQICLLLAGCVTVITSSTPVYAQVKGKSVPTLVSWHGEIKMEQRQEAPPGKYITDPIAWAKLWKAWRGMEPLPLVNFNETLILVGTGNDPNRISVISTLTEDGNLQQSWSMTMIGYHNPTTCSYQLALVHRAGIKSIDGVKLK